VCGSPEILTKGEGKKTESGKDIDSINTAAGGVD